jgi:nitrogen fixation protein FixH
MKMRRFTGWHMLATMVGFFGVVIAVNVTMARIAIGSFGGVVVENSYVASQEFNGWLDAAEAQEALGWQVETTWRDDGRLAMQVTGAPGVLAASASARHPLGHLPTRELVFEQAPSGEYVSTEELPQGRWTLRLTLASGSDEWRREEELR